MQYHLVFVTKYRRQVIDNTVSNRLKGPLIFTEEEIEIINQLQPSITSNISYVEEMRAKWLMNGGIDDEWDAYIAELDRMGL